MGVMETLSKLFNGHARVKVMRLFLFNPNQLFSLDQIINKAKVTPKEAKAEVHVLEQAGMIKEKKTIFTDLVKKGRVEKVIKKKAIGYYLDSTFEYLVPLQTLLIQSRPLRPEEIVKRLA